MTASRPATIRAEERGCPYRWKTPEIVGFTSSSRRGEQSNLGGLKTRRSLRKRYGMDWGGDRVSEVRLDGSARKNHASHESERARRSGSDVVKRRIPRSFEFDGCRPTGQRRGVSLEEKPGAHEARVLVVVAVGSRSQSVGIGIDLHGALQDKPEKGDLARRKSSNPADAGGGGPEMDCDGSSAVTQQR